MSSLGLSKNKMVEHLFKLASANAGGKVDVHTKDPVPFVSRSPGRRQRKGDHPSRLPTANLPTDIIEEKSVSKQKELAVSWQCTNSACKARLRTGDSFCKRCSCCICHQFDDNKDPSLWIVCNSDETREKDTYCQLSCHIQCALDWKVAGVVRDSKGILMDGGYRCQGCGKVSSLIGCWQKQLIIARNARRVDIVRHRLSLSQKLLNGTHMYRHIHEIIVKANGLLASEVGSTPVETPAKLPRGIVNRLSSWSEVQKLIDLALQKAESSKPQGPSIMGELLEVVLAEDPVNASCSIEFQDISSKSIVVAVKGESLLLRKGLIGYKLWHCKAVELSYSKNPTCIIPKDERKALISNLQACTEYVFKVVPFSDRGDAACCEARCFTKSIEIFRRPLQPQSLGFLFKVANNSGQRFSKYLRVENEGFLHNTGGTVTNYLKFPELESTLMGSEKQRDNNCKTIEVANSSLNAFLIPAAEVSSVEDEKCRQGKIGVGFACFRNGGDRVRQVESQYYHNGVVKNSNAISVEDKKAIQSGVTNSSELKATAARKYLIDGNIFKENPAPQDCLLGHANVSESDDASDPGISHTARGENDVSPDASGSVGTNGKTYMNDSVLINLRSDEFGFNRHGEGWAVQLHNEDSALPIQHESGVVRKRTIQVLERAHNSYCLKNGCTNCATETSISASRSYECCVKVVRWLECEGHITEDFRMKFLTWFSLRATEHEKRVLAVFIDAFQDNPGSLAKQLIDTFEDAVYAKRQQHLPNGFCDTLWH